MEREKFRLLAQKLGLKTGAEIEKRMEFEEQVPQASIEVASEGEMEAPTISHEQNQNDYLLP